MVGKTPDITELVGAIPYRVALAGGWIDQPFMSQRNPDGVGSMVVVQVEPQFRWMDRAGICGSTRKIALELWNGRVPEGDRMQLVRRLYETENAGKADPSGSQDMIGLVYPGVNRLDYDASHEGGYFPRHIETNTDPEVARWFEKVFYVLPVGPRPPGYNPLRRQNLDPEWIARLGRSGRMCFDAIVNRDLAALGASMNECMACWHALLPDVVEEPREPVDLLALLNWYQRHYPGAMYSGCGGGYLFVVSDRPVPGGFRIKVKTE